MSTMMRDGTFDFYTAHFESGDRIVFRVRIDREAMIRAREKGIVRYRQLSISNDFERKMWYNGHPSYC